VLRKIRGGKRGIILSENILAPGRCGGVGGKLIGRATGRGNE
jgi:hypothetical protein